MKNWIITRNITDDTYIEFYKFYGTEKEVKKQLLKMAQNGSFLSYASGEELQNYKKVKDCVEYDIDENSWYIKVSESFGDVFEVFTAKALDDIKEWSQED